MDIRTLCLGILTFGDATGYEIKKRLEGPMRHYYDASFGSIYPALAGLKRDGQPGFPRWMTNLMTCFADSAIRINAIPSALRANPMSPGG